MKNDKGSEKNNGRVLRRFVVLIPLVVLLVMMFVQFTNVYLYGDDFYYSRDIKQGLKALPDIAHKDFLANGRVWVHVVLSLLLKYDALVFRIVNPIVITLAAWIMAKSSDIGKKKASLPVYIICACYFVGMHLLVARTTLYYAACSLNYLYPAVVCLLYGYLFTRHLLSDKAEKISPLLLIVAFFAASSTQQCGAAAVGYAVLLTLYAVFICKKKLKAKFYVNFIPVILGFSIVMYGSVRRFLFESSNGSEGGFGANVVRLIKTNIFSVPVMLFTIIVMACVFAGLACLIKIHKESRLRIFDIVLLAVNSVFAIGYVIVVYFERIDIADNIWNEELTIDGRIVFAFAFTLVYLFSVCYLSAVIMLRKGNPLLLCSAVNAVCAQLMLLIVDARYTSAFKMVLPSQMLMMTFVVYIVDSIFSEHRKLPLRIASVASVAVLCAVSVVAFCSNYKGYRDTGAEIEYNLNAIKDYQKSDDKRELVLKKVKNNKYGYNNGNWNSMPYFMRECYRIRKDTEIKYEKQA